jgi:hypothetical protein
MTRGASDGGLPLSTRPDDDDVAFDREHGWWISPKVFSDDFIDTAVDAAERFYRARDRTLPFEDGYSNWTEDDGFDVVRNNEFVSLQSDDLRRCAASRCSARWPPASPAAPASGSSTTSSSTSRRQHPGR